MLDCPCHQEPAYWQKDPRLAAGGHWRCAVKKRAQDRACHERHREARLAARREQQLERWHAPEGGYVKARRRALAAQRAEIAARLDQLHQEANGC